MSYRRRRLSYQLKKSRFRRLSGRTRLILGIVALCVLTVSLTVLWGNTLGQCAQESALERARARSRELPEPVEWVRNAPDAIRAPLFSIDGDIATLPDRIRTRAASGITALSLPLYTNGTPIYTSAVAIALGYAAQPADKNDEIGLPRLCATASVAGIYTSGVLACTWQSEANVPARRVRATYEAALAAEMSESGCDEILLTDLIIDDAHMEETLAFLRDIRENAPAATIGVALSCASLVPDSGTALHAGDLVGTDIGSTVYTLLAYADFCALDLSDADTLTLTDGDSGETHPMSYGELLEAARTAIALYRLRLLVPEAQADKTGEWETLGYTNWQLLPGEAAPLPPVDPSEPGGEEPSETQPTEPTEPTEPENPTDPDPDETPDAPPAGEDE